MYVIFDSVNLSMNKVAINTVTIVVHVFFYDARMKVIVGKIKRKKERKKERKKVSL